MAEQSPLPSNPADLRASVIIPNYNGLRFLPVCLGALEAQTHPASSTEVIVVDDASTDGSAAFVRERYPRVRVVELASNRGLAAACNAGGSRRRVICW
jgi:glycosyltransferase involved in cell wall biosynthesis